MAQLAARMADAGLARLGMAADTGVG